MMNTSQKSYKTDYFLPLSINSTKAFKFSHDSRQISIATVDLVFHRILFDSENNELVETNAIRLTNYLQPLCDGEEYYELCTMDATRNLFCIVCVCNDAFGSALRSVCLFFTADEIDGKVTLTKVAEVNRVNLISAIVWLPGTDDTPTLAVVGDDYRATYFGVKKNQQEVLSVTQIESNGAHDQFSIFQPLDSLILQTTFIKRENLDLCTIGTSTGLVEISSGDGKKTSLKHDLPIACLQFFDIGEDLYLFVGPAIGPPCVYAVVKKISEESFQFENRLQLPSGNDVLLSHDIFRDGENFILALGYFENLIILYKITVVASMPIVESSQQISIPGAVYGVKQTAPDVLVVVSDCGLHVISLINN